MQLSTPVEGQTRNLQCHTEELHGQRTHGKTIFMVKESSYLPEVLCNTLKNFGHTQCNFQLPWRGKAGICNATRKNFMVKELMVKPFSWSRKPHTFWKFCVIPSKILVTLNATFNSRGGANQEFAMPHGRTSWSKNSW